MEIFVDDDTKLTLHGLQQYYIRLEETEKNKKLNDLLDLLDFNQVRRVYSRCFLVICTTDFHLVHKWAFSESNSIFILTVI